MTDQGREFVAVQENPSSYCMDWPVIEFDESSSGGTLFVLDEQGRTVGYAGIAGTAECDDAADAALDTIGWTRRGPWRPDGFGRHTARVQALAPRQPIPRQAHSTGSLAEEAALHFA